MLINKFSQLPLTSEVANVPKLKAAIYSIDVYSKSAAPCSKVASTATELSGTSKPQVQLGSC